MVFASLEDILAQFRRKSRFLFSLGVFALGACTIVKYDAAQQAPPNDAALQDSVRASYHAPAPPTAPMHIVNRGENLWTIVKRHYHTATNAQTARMVNAVVSANAPAEPSLNHDTKSVIDGRVRPIPDGIRGDELRVGERITLPLVDSATSRTAQPLSPAVYPASELSPSSTPVIPYAIIGLGALAVGAALLARAPAQSSTGAAPQGRGIDDAVNRYLGNYAHGDSRDARVVDILAETGVSARQLYRTLRERKLMTRREMARHAHDYVAEKLAAARARGADMRSTATAYGVSYRRAQQLATATSVL